MPIELEKLPESNGPELTATLVANCQKILETMKASRWGWTTAGITDREKLVQTIQSTCQEAETAGTSREETLKSVLALLEDKKNVPTGPVVPVPFVGHFRLYTSGSSQFVKELKNHIETSLQAEEQKVDDGFKPAKRRRKNRGNGHKA